MTLKTGSMDALIASINKCFREGDEELLTPCLTGLITRGYGYIRLQQMIVIFSTQHNEQYVVWKGKKHA